MISSGMSLIKIRGVGLGPSLRIPPVTWCCSDRVTCTCTLTNPVGTGGVLDMCLYFGCGGVGGEGVGPGWMGGVMSV